MKNIHIGAYGICISDGKILMIKKARGPYKGMYDLPGGSIEEFEPILDCLERELQEETGANLLAHDFIGFNENFCEYIGSGGFKKPFHHIGFYFKVKLDARNLKIDPDGEDSLGAEWINLNLIKDIQISPIARPMILKSF